MGGGSFNFQRGGGLSPLLSGSENISKRVTLIGTTSAVRLALIHSLTEQAEKHIRNPSFLCLALGLRVRIRMNSPEFEFGTNSLEFGGNILKLSV